MTNEEAKNLIVKLLDSAESEGFLHLAKAYRQAIDMAIKALEPCEDAISRQAAIEKMQTYRDDCAITSVYTRLGFETAINVVKSLPSVTPKQRMGHWIRKTNEYGASSYVCSECGKWHPTHNHSLGFDYCNGCGAKMESEG